MAVTVSLAEILPEWLEMAMTPPLYHGEAFAERMDYLTRVLSQFTIEVEQSGPPTEMATALTDERAFEIEQARGGRDHEDARW